jgi:hypothetical protein
MTGLFMCYPYWAKVLVAGRWSHVCRLTLPAEPGWEPPAQKLASTRRKR